MMDYFLDFTILTDEVKEKVLMQDKIPISFIFNMKTENDVLDMNCLYIGPSKSRFTQKDLPVSNNMKMT